MIADLRCAEVAGTALYAVGVAGAPIRNVSVERVIVDRAVTASRIEQVDDFRLADVVVAGRPLTRP